MPPSLDTLYRKINSSLPRTKETKLAALFNITKEEILVGKKYKDVSMDGTNNPRRFVNFKSELGSEPKIATNGTFMVQKKIKKLSISTVVISTTVLNVLTIGNKLRLI